MIRRMSLLLALCAALSACASHRTKTEAPPPPSVQPELAFGQYPATAAFNQQVYSCKEALSGGRTVGGGFGCK
jgi:hypothetical protein